MVNNSEEYTPVTYMIPVTEDEQARFILRPPPVSRLAEPEMVTGSIGNFG
jgi:ribosomal protein L11